MVALGVERTLAVMVFADGTVVQGGLGNEVLSAELTGINQYFIHAKMCENWGYERLAHKVREESIDEMRHAGGAAVVAADPEFVLRWTADAARL